MRHLLSLIPPLLPLAFLLSAPHSLYGLLLFLGLSIALILLDACGGRARESTDDSAPRWLLDLLLCVHAAIHFVVLALYLGLAMHFGIRLADFWVGALLVGYNAGWSAIAVAHELIHRGQSYMRILGRTILCTVCYEHFYTEHLRGHHARVATAEDAATARFGESLVRFKLRTVPAQFASAWRLESKRVGLLRNRVLHGVIAEISMLAWIIVALGPAAALGFVLVAYRAINLLETVNYIEHWGLVHEGRNVRMLDSWDTDSAFSLHALIGLARHADHHVHASRPFQRLRRSDESPKLPRGYFSMVLLAHARNAAFRRIMTAELKRLRLGPFATSQGRLPR